MATSLVGGASRILAIGLLTTDFVGTKPLGAVDAALAAQREAFGEDDLENLTCQHPAGNMPAEQLLGLRIGGRAIGADEQLSPDAVQRVGDGTAPMAPIIARLGVFGDGPSGTVPDDAPLAERLLDLMGRRAITPRCARPGRQSVASGDGAT